MRTNRTFRLGFAAALLALLLAPLALGGQAANAQGPTTARYYGVGLEAGDAVGAWINGVQCASTTADASGNWILDVDESCPAADGDTVNFSLNGAVAEETETWMPGGTPSDQANGVTLTVSDDGAGMDDGDDSGAMTPDKPDTGNAGLAATSSASALAALTLALVALAATAATRLSTRRLS